jgi:predicted TIM-barrel fold metal-dependent hydrolase
MQPITRRSALLTALGAAASSQPKAPIVNASEHAWVLNSKFPMPSELSVCPGSVPASEYSAEYLLSEMSLYNVEHVVISHVCYYGRDNSYPAWCLKRYPGRFAALGLLIGHRLYAPNDKENPARLERLMGEEHFAGLRISPITTKTSFGSMTPFAIHCGRKPSSWALHSTSSWLLTRSSRLPTWPHDFPA